MRDTAALPFDGFAMLAHSRVAAGISDFSESGRHHSYGGNGRAEYSRNDDNHPLPASQETRYE